MVGLQGDRILLIDRSFAKPYEFFDLEGRPPLNERRLAAILL